MNTCAYDRYAMSSIHICEAKYSFSINANMLHMYPIYSIHIQSQWNVNVVFAKGIHIIYDLSYFTGFTHTHTVMAKRWISYNCQWNSFKWMHSFVFHWIFCKADYHLEYIFFRCVFLFVMHGYNWHIEIIYTSNGVTRYHHLDLRT